MLDLGNTDTTEFTNRTTYLLSKIKYKYIHGLIRLNLHVASTVVNFTS